VASWPGPMRAASSIKLHPVPDEEAFAASFATLGAWRRSYTQVQAPALAIYASTFFPLDHSDAALAQKLRTFEQDVMVPFRQASMECIRRELPSPTMLELAGRTHKSSGRMNLALQFMISYAGRHHIEPVVRRSAYRARWVVKRTEELTPWTN
jgi:hypothetical protein